MWNLVIGEILGQSLYVIILHMNFGYNLTESLQAEFLGPGTSVFGRSLAYIGCKT